MRQKLSEHKRWEQRKSRYTGAHVGAGPEAGVKQIVKGLNEVLWKEQIPQIALETMVVKERNRPYV